jgi:hypothetical protein
VLCGSTLALLLAGGVVAAQFRGLESPETFDAAIRNAKKAKVADIPSVDGKVGRGVFVQTTSSGLLCLVDAPNENSLAGGGGCNRLEDPFGANQVFVSFAYDGGPAVEDVTDARLIGLVTSQVAAVDVLMSDGTRREMRLWKARVGDDDFQAFGYRFKKADLRRGVAPTAVVALDAGGREIDRQPTGFTG